MSPFELLSSNTLTLELIFENELDTVVFLNLLIPFEFEKSYPDALLCSTTISPFELDNSNPNCEISSEIVISPFEVEIWPFSASSLSTLTFPLDESIEKLCNLF